MKKLPKEPVPPPQPRAKLQLIQSSLQPQSQEPRIQAPPPQYIPPHLRKRYQLDIQADFAPPPQNPSIFRAGQGKSYYESDDDWPDLEPQAQQVSQDDVSELPETCDQSEGEDQDDGYSDYSDYDDDYGDYDEYEEGILWYKEREKIAE
ncbi:hypothetical protein EG329_011903 [Mollisiaceae sp. DMI_Dod_QoI]|nr:hypothetical protein EG329_011903 [Helotiales sp. DMI_Dod_QoI]